MNQIEIAMDAIDNGRYIHKIGEVLAQLYRGGITEEAVAIAACRKLPANNYLALVLPNAQRGRRSMDKPDALEIFVVYGGFIFSSKLEIDKHKLAIVWPCHMSDIICHSDCKVLWTTKFCVDMARLSMKLDVEARESLRLENQWWQDLAEEIAVLYGPIGARYWINENMMYVGRVCSDDILISYTIKHIIGDPSSKLIIQSALELSSQVDIQTNSLVIRGEIEREISGQKRPKDIALALIRELNTHLYSEAYFAFTVRPPS